MAVKRYSVKKDGEMALSPHFKVKEFACKDGSDTVLISEELIGALERLREKLAAQSVRIHSGYRTAAHNRKVGGSPTSKHKKGLAADIFCRRDGKVLPAETVCRAAQTLGLPGIGYISSQAVHIDVRPHGRFWADEKKGILKIADFFAYFRSGNPYAEPVKTMAKGSRGEGVRWVQFQLRRAGEMVAVDGSFGKKTDGSVRRYQQKNGLSVDGRVGSLTRARLREV